MATENLPRESELEVIVQVIQVDEEVPEVSAKTTEEHPVAKLLGESDEEHAHPFVELLVPQAEELHGRLAHLDDLAFRETLVDHESVLFDVQLFSDLLPFPRTECLLDILRHVGEDEAVHDDAWLGLSGPT